MFKKTLSAVLLVMVILSSLVPAVSADVYGDWEYTVNGTEITITKYIGKATETVIIPSEINDKPVTTIGGNIFSSSYNLGDFKTVILPSTITSVVNQAFYGPRLTDIIVDNGNTNYMSEDGVLYSKDKTVLVCCPAGRTGEFTIPNGITSIGDSAFSSCADMTNVMIPDSVTSIGDVAFWNCGSLISITIPSNVISIGDAVFTGCIRLTDITVDDNPNYVFENGALFNKKKTILICCPAGKALKEFIIPDGVLSIGARAFSDCGDMTSVTIPESVKFIGSGAFYSCNGLTGIVIPDGITVIESASFFSCYKLANITIPNSVTSIGFLAFSGCSGLVSVTIPCNVEFIDDMAFYSCFELYNVYFDSATPPREMGLGVFGNVRPYARAIVPKGATEYGADGADWNGLTVAYGDKTAKFVTIKSLETEDNEGNITLTFDTNAAVDAGYVINAAIYDDSNKMLKYIPVPVAEGEKHYEVPCGTVPGAKYAKIFIWESRASLKPASNAKTVNITQK